MTNPEELDALVPIHPLRIRLLRLTISSMLLTIVLLSALFLFDPPLDFQDFLRIIQQVLPIFVGFLLSAISYATGTQHAGAIARERYDILRLVLNFAFLFYWVGTVVLTALFFWSHSRYATPGGGMQKDVFFGVLTILLSVVTGAAGAIATKVFISEYKPASTVADRGGKQA